MRGNKVRFASTALAVCVVVACVLGISGCGDTDKRANIVLINLDDADVDLLDEWAINKYFPNIKKLIQDKGVRFSNFHVVAPLCGPSRGALFRGQYPHNTGIEKNQLGWKIFYDRGYTDSEIGMWMRDAGYETALIGKYCHAKYPEASRDKTYVPPGWDNFHASNGGQYFRMTRIINGELVREGKKQYRTDLEAASAVEILSEHDAEKPLFLYVAPFAPHIARKPRKREGRKQRRFLGMVAPRHKKAFRRLRLPDTPDFNEEDVSDKTPQFAALAKADAERVASTHDHYRERVQAVLAVDEMIGRIFEVLTERKMLDNTYIFLTSDNGFQLLHHRSFGKKDPFDRTTRVQLLVRGPGIPEGKTFQHLLGHIDLVPTFLELADAGAPHFVDGKSFAPLLEDPAAHDEKQWQPQILIENVHGKHSTVLDLDLEYDALRRFSDVYVEWANGDREYYDLAKDPYQLENSWKTLDVADRQELSASLAVMADCAGGECVGGAKPDPVDTQLELENDTNFEIREIRLSGSASDDKSVASVQVVIRDVANRNYLGEKGFSPDYASIDATLSASAQAQTSWELETKLAPGHYWVSARAIDTDGNEDPLIPTAFFSVMQDAAE